jgi:hypothetical protein
MCFQTKALSFLLLALAPLGARAVAPAFRPDRHCEISATDSRRYSVWNCEPGFKLVVLKGDGVQRASALGKLLAAGTVSDRVYRYFSSKIDTEAGKLSGVAQVLYGQLVRWVHEIVPVPLREEVKALGEASGQGAAYFRRAFLLPDLGSALQGLLGSFGCTTAIHKSADGSMLFGRNLDFSGVGHWDSTPAITVLLPEEGSRELRRASFGAEGLFLASITGLNEAGIAVVVHQNYSKEFFARGIPLFYVADLVLRSSRSYDEAIALLDRYRPGNAWTFVVADLRSGRAAAVESSSKRFFVRPMQGSRFAQTNHFADPSAIRKQTLSHGQYINSRNRYEKALELLGRIDGRPAAMEDMADLLSYQRESSGELSSHSDILKANTISSAVFQSGPAFEDAVAWMGVDRAPVPGGRWAGFRASELFDLDPSRARVPVFELKEAVNSSPERRARQLETSAAYVAAMEGKDPARARELLAGHSSLEAFVARAAMSLKLKDWERALEESEAGLAVEKDVPALSAHLRESLGFLRIQALIGLGERARARSLGREMEVEGVGNPLYARSLKRLRTPSIVPPKPLGVGFDFFAGDLIRSIGRH